MYLKRLKRKFRYNKKRRYLVTSIILLLCFLGLGYAALATDLSIVGISKFSGASWDVHFANIQAKSGSVTPTTAPTISNNTTVSFAATLEDPGDFYEFNIDVVNAGSMDAMIDSVRILPVLTQEQQVYFDYIVTYSDGIELAEKHKLDAGDTENLRVAFIYKTLQDTTEYPDTDQNFNVSVQINYVQQDSTAIPKPNPSFATDSWETIIANAKSGTIPSYYTVGSTKTVDLGNDLGTHTLRIANTTTPSECYTDGFSQTACGFVLEFADIITEHNMNSTDTNAGGWPVSEMRTYLNNINDSTSIINSLPTVIKNSIIDTTVISGHGSTSGETNFTSTDQLYLLSTVEVYGSNYQYDTVTLTETRQLDYYANLGVTTSNYSGDIKQYNGSNDLWWLRSASSRYTDTFYSINAYGFRSNNIADHMNGVAPAFRLAGPEPPLSSAQFASDSWETVVSNVQSGKTYELGSTKTVDLGNGLGTHTLRVSNTSTPSECSTEGFSKTACGFVLEFVDIISTNKMNNTATNVGGWPASDMRTYLNDTNSSTSIINSLPVVLKNAIIDTTVVSGHGPTSGETNFTSTDKLYLLSTHELWDDVDTSNYGINDLDSAYSNTKQLDYYQAQGVTTNNLSGVIKQLSGTDSIWWLRSAVSSFTNDFYSVNTTGGFDYYYAADASGVSPAFRIR